MWVKWIEPNINMEWINTLYHVELVKISKILTLLFGFVTNITILQDLFLMFSNQQRQMKLVYSFSQKKSGSFNNDNDHFITLSFCVCVCVSLSLSHTHTVSFYVLQVKVILILNHF